MDPTPCDRTEKSLGFIFTSVIQVTAEGLVFYFINASSHLINHLNTNCKQFAIRHKIIKCYQISFELKTKIEEIVGFYIFVKITHIVIEVATMIYSFCEDIHVDYYSQKNILFVLNGYWMVQIIFQIMFLTYSVTHFCNKVANIVDLFEDITTNNDNENDNNVKRFFLQVYTLPQKFTAHGLFVLDWSLLYFMTGSVTSHLIYLIQFKQTSS
ncbi:uncharacterized protein LOC123007693 [Tribolium madens]|uniref:uncharacterized protein LOC123007693 n=1 Tax=Tribolium madens TaxID=41895 RepID=UPI001CF75EF8|nr:uncharacterized protein LOC123007693 [Tribolium madens]